MSAREKISPNFFLDEFECSCSCGFNDINMDLVERIQRVRDSVGPIGISSACRCETWNQECGGKINSAHTKGLALDVVCGNSRERYKLLMALLLEFDRIGISSDGFIHVDTDASRDENVCWTY